MDKKINAYAKTGDQEKAEVAQLVEMFLEYCG